ncbi:hypothetical protein R1flu_005869 [Riccia fluitans]|uniref:Uncharacterized protein n=1 Tax=Riccia fluitans TaxID=41844 RepID=A0ABD1YV74_9MARC
MWRRPWLSLPMHASDAVNAYFTSSLEPRHLLVLASSMMKLSPSPADASGHRGCGEGVAFAACACVAVNTYFVGPSPFFKDLWLISWGTPGSRLDSCFVRPDENSP